MLYAYIGVALVIGLLIGFVTLSVIWLAKRVTNDIRSKTADVISSYDSVLEAKRSELRELEAQLRSAQAALPKENEKTEERIILEAPDMSSADMLNTAERIGGTLYVESGISEAYHKIRSAFNTDPEDALKAVMLESGSATQGEASSLLAELDYNTVYRLSILSEEEQKQILAEALSGKSAELLEKYCAANQRFSAIAFYDWLSGIAEMEPHTPRLRVSQDYNGKIPQGVEVVVDPDICEGFQIEVNNVLYDYCIKGKELS